MPEMKKNAILLSLPASVTFESATACSDGLAVALTGHKDIAHVTHVTVDASAVQDFDSSVLAVLLQCRRDVEQKGKVFQVQNMPAQLQELSILYGVEALFKQ